MPISTLRNSTTVDHRLTAVADAQLGLVTRQQAIACGLGTDALRKRCQRGRMHQVMPDVFAIGRTVLDRHTHAMAAVLATGPHSAVTGYCALQMRGAGRWYGRPTEVVSTERHRPISGVVIHSTTQLQADEVTRFGDVPITTPERMVVDLADLMSEYQLAFVIQQARVRCSLRIPVLKHLSGRHRHREGHPRLVAAMEMHLAGSAGTRSEREDSFIALCRRAGLPDPVVNRRVAVLGERIEVDCAWPSAGLCVEVDGWTHDMPYYRDRDPDDDARLRSKGIHVLRVRDDMLEWGVAETCRRLGMPVPRWLIDSCTASVSRERPWCPGS